MMNSVRLIWYLTIVCEKEVCLVLLSCAGSECERFGESERGSLSERASEEEEEEREIYFFTFRVQFLCVSCANSSWIGSWWLVFFFSPLFSYVFVIFQLFLLLSNLVSPLGFYFIFIRFRFVFVLPMIWFVLFIYFIKFRFLVFHGTSIQKGWESTWANLGSWRIVLSWRFAFFHSCDTFVLSILVLNLVLLKVWLLTQQQ